MKMNHKYSTGMNYTRGNTADMGARYRERQGMEYSDNNRFADKRQVVLKALGGKDPRLEAKYTYYDANMTVNGDSAKSFGRTLTKGMDKKAFPID